MLRDFNGLSVATMDSSLQDDIQTHHGRPRTASADAPDTLDTLIQIICSGDIDLLLFTEADQVRALLARAAGQDLTAPLRDALRQIAIGSINSSCSDVLREYHLTADFEADQPEASGFVFGMARLAHALVTKKRTAVDAGVDTAYWQRTDMRWPHASDHHNINTESMFLRACRRESTDYTPIWLLRQAGRYQRSYMNLKGDMDFLDMCKIPELTAEITLMAVERLGVDAAIIFADILPILQPMGFSLEYIKGTGPVIHNPIRSGRAVDQLEEVHPESQHYVYEAIRLARPALPPTIPLIGFSGAPFTLAAYAIEGRSSRNFQYVKSFMYSDPGAWHAFMEKIARAITGYLNEQIEAGVQAIQLFDSWVGCLSPDDYREFVLPYTGYIFSHLIPGVPTIHFGTSTGALLELMREAGGDVIGLDWRVDLAEAWHQLDYDVAVQGNLDPIILFSSPDVIRKRAKAILHKADGKAGHIFNLGHGILPGTPEDHVIALVDAVHEMGTNQQFDQPSY
jgi:uroporphyrinogen decarboxylase